MEGHQPRQVPPHKRESDQDSLRPLTLTNICTYWDKAMSWLVWTGKAFVIVGPKENTDD